MKAANLAGAVLGAILKVAFAVIVVYLVYTGASTCYDYGYRIFTEPAISSGEGRKITVTLTSDMSATEIGNTLQEKGLVRDGRLFALQYLLSEYKKGLEARNLRIEYSHDRRRDDGSHGRTDGKRNGRDSGDYRQRQCDYR